MSVMAVRLHAVVQPGHRVEVESPDLKVGDEVEVLVLQTSPAATAPRRHILDVLDSVPADLRGRRTVEEVDRAMDEERDAWDG